MDAYIWNWVAWSSERDIERERGRKCSKIAFIIHQLAFANIQHVPSGEPFDFQHLCVSLHSCRRMHSTWRARILAFDVIFMMQVCGSRNIAFPLFGTCTLFLSSCSEQPKRIIPVASTILPLSLFCAFHHWILFHFSSLLLQFFLSLVCWLAQFVGFYTNFVCAWSVVVVCFQNIYLCCFMMICFYQNF